MQIRLSFRSAYRCQSLPKPAKQRQFLSNWDQLIRAQLSWGQLIRAQLSWGQLIRAQLSWGQLSSAQLGPAELSSTGAS